LQRTALALSPSVFAPFFSLCSVVFGKILVGDGKFDFPFFPGFWKNLPVLLGPPEGLAYVYRELHGRISFLFFLKIVTAITADPFFRLFRSSHKAWWTSSYCNCPLQFLLIVYVLWMLFSFFPGGAHHPLLSRFPPFTSSRLSVRPPPLVPLVPLGSHWCEMLSSPFLFSFLSLSRSLTV